MLDESHIRSVWDPFPLDSYHLDVITTRTHPLVPATGGFRTDRVATGQTLDGERRPVLAADEADSTPPSNDTGHGSQTDSRKGKGKMTDAEHEAWRISKLPQAIVRLEMVKMMARIRNSLGSEVMFLLAFNAALQMWNTSHPPSMTPSVDQAQERSNEAGPSSRPMQRQSEDQAEGANVRRSEQWNQAIRRIMRTLLQDAYSHEIIQEIFFPIVADPDPPATDQRYDQNEPIADHSIDAQIAYAYQSGQWGY